MSQEQSSRALGVDVSAKDNDVKLDTTVNATVSPSFFSPKRGDTDSNSKVDIKAENHSTVSNIRIGNGNGDGLCCIL